MSNQEEQQNNQPDTTPPHETNGEEEQPQVTPQNNQLYSELTPEHYMDQIKNDMKTKTDVEHLFIQDLDGQTVEYDRSNTPKKAILYWKSDKNCQFTVSKRANPVKIFIQDCHDCVFHFLGEITTGFVELWRCSNIIVHVNIEIGTFQVDLSNNVKISYQHKKYLGSVVQNCVENLQIEFADSEENNFVTGVEQLKQQYQDFLDTDQFISRWIRKELLTERLIRVQGGYPTTERELAEDEEQGELKTRESLNKFLEENGQSLGIDEKNLIAKSKEGKGEMERRVQVEAQSNMKKHNGNKAFVAGKFQVAIDCFTEGIELTPDNHLLFSNRAACYLKIGEWEKALLDSNKCIELKEDFTKGHFRKGLSLIELGRFEEAYASIKEAYDLEPEDQDIVEKLEFVKEKVSKS